MAMDRAKTLPIVRKPKDAGHPELDFGGGSIRELRFTGRTGRYEVGRQDIGRADRIGHKVYGDHRYWWILLAFNNIHDVWNDLYPGLILKIPPKELVERWYAQARRSASDRQRDG